MRALAGALVRLGTPATFARAGIAFLAALGLALAAILVLALAFWGAHLAYEECLALYGGGGDDVRRCVDANLAVIRAPLVAAAPFVLALAAAAWLCLVASPTLLVLAFGRRGRVAAARERLGRLEDMYSRGALSDATFETERRRLREWASLDAGWARERDAGRLALGLLLVGMPLLLPGALLLGWLAQQPWNNASSATLPGAMALALAAWAALALALAAAWWGARGAAAARAGEAAEAERAWERVLEEARAASTTPPRGPA